MKKYLPFINVGLSITFAVIAIVLRNGTPDAEMPITNLASTFMFIGAAICFIVGLVTYFLRHDDEVW